MSITRWNEKAISKVKELSDIKYIKKLFQNINQ